ncbi:MAG: cadmium-translocating P-type ATPase [Bacteroidia bacterium]|nr:cadmium-translocating P-type ATPase [Bacteroidia bacterium]
MSDANITNLKVEGMTCVNCARSVEKALKSKGAEDIHVDFLSDEVSFSDVSHVGHEELVKSIEKLGYKVSGNGVSIDQGHDHHDHSGIRWKLITALVFTIPLLVMHFLHFVDQPWVAQVTTPMIQFLIAIPVFLIGFYHFGKSSFNSLRHGEINMDVLIFIGGTTAFIYSLIGLIMKNPDMIFFETAATIFCFVLLGNYIEERASRGTTSAIDALKELQQTSSFRKSRTGEWEEVKADELKIGDVIMVKEGDSVPADGKIMIGSAALNLSLITGESIPQHHQVGDQVISGAIVQDGNLEIEVNKTGDESTLGKIIQLVKRAQSEKPGIQRLADKISGIFVPLVLTIAALAFLFNFYYMEVGLQGSILRSIAVLVISCPCAMGLATPTAVAVGLGRLASNGILMKGSDTIERLAAVEQYVFDKTGTLTTGEFKVKSFEVFDESEVNVASIIHQIESRSSHPIAKSLIQFFDNPGRTAIRIKETDEVAGEGMNAKDNLNNEYFIGSDKDSNEGHIVLKRNNKVIAKFMIEDEIKSEAKDLIQYINQSNKETILLSGDNHHKTSEVARILKFDNYYAEQKPDQKLALIEQISKDTRVAMVGDGINDAASLTRADIGISLGDATSVSIQAADIVLLNSNLSKLKETIGIAKVTLKTIKQNLFWAFGYNIIAIPLAIMGLVNPMWAALFMGFSDVVIIGNSLLLKKKDID